MRGRLTLVVTALLVASVAVTMEASAGGGDGNTTQQTIGATAEGGLPSAGNRPIKSSPLTDCTFRASLIVDEVVTYINQQVVVIQAHPDSYDPDKLYHLATCPQRLFGGVAWSTWPVGDPAPQDVIDALGRIASDSTPVPLLAPLTSPGGDRDFPLIVNMETWFWADADLWAPVQATASIPEFGISVTATATPTTSTWDPGDGSDLIVCAQGTAWTSGTSATSDCGHEYKRSTQHDGESDPYTLTATIDWEVTYACAPAGACTGPPNVPGTIVTEVTRDVWVTEIKGIITG